MSIQIPNWYVTQFSTNIQMLLQDNGGKVAPLFTQGSYQGEQASPVDQLSQIEANEVTSRFQPMDRVDASVDRRWIFPRDFDLPQLIDSFDKLRLLTDPSSQYIENAAKAMRRAKDNIAVAGFFADAKTGKIGGTTETWATTLTTSGGQNVAVATGASAATNLNVAKLREVIRQAMFNEIDLESEQIYGLLNAKNHDSLLAEAQIINTDYNDKPVLVEGKVKRFLGIEFKMFQRLATGTDDAAGTSTMTPFWVPGGMHFGTWSDVETSISKRNDIKGEPWQAYLKASFGSTRIESKRVFRVWTR